MYKNRNGKCDEDTFWDCVNEIGWPGRDSTEVKRDLLKAWTPEFSESFRSIFSEKSRVVGASLNAYESDGDPDYWIGDDGFSDLTAHVVGLGKEVFEREASNPELIAERASKCKYKESFAYCIPYAPTTSRSFEEWVKAMGYPMDEEGWRWRNNGPWGDSSETFEEYKEHIFEEYMCCLRGDWRDLEHDHYAIAMKPYRRRCDFAIEALETDGRSLTDAEADICQGLRKLRSFFLSVEEGDIQKALDISEDAMYQWWYIYFLCIERGLLEQRLVDKLPMARNKRHGGENLINDFRFYIGELDKFKCMKHLREIQKSAA